jgi:hypothetical protein
MSSAPDASLRLKNGCAHDDGQRLIRVDIQMADDTVLICAPWGSPRISRISAFMSRDFDIVPTRRQ